MSNLLKSRYVVKKDETRVIDSNNLVASRLQKLAEIMDSSPISEDDFVEGFTSGLNAEQLELLLEDNPESEAVYGETQEMYSDNQVDEEYIKQTEAAAQQLMQEAQAEAENIIAAANNEASSIRDSAREQGYSQGFESGQQEGLKTVDDRLAELEEAERLRKEEFDKQLADMEPMLVDAITGIYEHIFHVSLSSNREIMLNLLHDTVRNIEGGKNFIIHVSKSDYEYINDRKEQLTEGLGSTDTIEVIEDLTLHQAECFVEASGGIYDCGIGTEMELLKKELMLLSYQKK